MTVGWRVSFVLLALVAGGTALATPDSGPGFDRVIATLEASADASMLEEVPARLAEARALLPPGDAARALRLEALACVLGRRDDYPAMAAEAEAGLRRAQAAAHPAAQVRFHLCAATAREFTNDDKAAFGHYDAAVDLARDQRLFSLLGLALTKRADLHSYRGDQARALFDLLEARRVYEQAGLKDQADAQLFNIAVPYRRIGAYAQARDYLDRNAERTRRSEDWLWHCRTWLQRGFLENDAADPQAALGAFEQAIASASRIDQAHRTTCGAMARAGLAESLSMLGNQHRALKLLREAQAGLISENDHDIVHVLRGRALARLGKHRDALASFDMAIRVTRDTTERFTATVREPRAATLLALGRSEEALADYLLYLQAQVSIDRTRRGWQESWLRHSFDSERRELEHRRLAAEMAAQEQQLAAAVRARRWQNAALASSALLLLALLALGLRLLRRARRLQVLASTDALTGVANRRSLEQGAAMEIERSQRQGTPLCLLILDIDHFKQVNDTGGHAVGDEVLRCVARAAQSCLRGRDQLGRTGGEEFVALLPGAGVDEAAHVAERLRACIAALDFPDMPSLQVTISLGLAERRPEEPFGTWLARADAALYRAKEAGRNRAVIAPNS